MIDAEAVSQTDTDGADVLARLAAELRPRGISIALARVQSNVSDLWRRAGVIEAIGGPERVFHTVKEAVDGIDAAAVRLDRERGSSRRPPGIRPRSPT